MAMRYCKDCELYECCMRTPLGGCQEFDNVAPKPQEPIVVKEAWKHLYEQLDWDLEKFRREVAKEMLPLTATFKITRDDTTVGAIPMKAAVKVAIEFADELIKQLKEKDKHE